MDTPLTALTGVAHPIVQTGMGWVAGPRLVSAAANAGALGILGSATMTPDQLRSAVREVRSRTARTFRGQPAGGRGRRARARTDHRPGGRKGRVLRARAVP
jgi:NAD(P)H-dependent flavin oxidoreductase YrpB (nitropropane dioxygenase family)